jgi:hypothetical protein
MRLLSQIRCRFALNNVRHPGVTQIAEGGGELLLFTEGVFVDAEDQGIIQRETFTGFAFCKLRINAGDGGGSHLFEAAQDAGALNR